MNKKANQKKVLGILLIIIGLGSLGAGIFCLTTSKEKEAFTEKTSTPIESRQLSQLSLAAEGNAYINSDVTSETTQFSTPSVTPSSNISEQKEVKDKSESSTNTETSDNHTKGVEFEKYVVGRFGTKYWSIQDWRGDKGVDGRYAEANTYPDLEMKLSLKGKEHIIAVECKWRSSFNEEGKIKWSYPEQIKRYNSFSASRQIPVFVFIGIGGTPGDPDKLYIVPLKRLSSHYISRNELSKYEMKSKRQIFYDAKTGDFRRD